MLLESVNAGSDTATKTSANRLPKALSTKVGEVASAGPVGTGAARSKGAGADKICVDVLVTLPAPMQLLLVSLKNYMFSMGDDVQRKELRLFAAFKRLKNFATVLLHRKNCLLQYLHVDPVAAVSVLKNARDVSNIGHWGTGNLEVSLSAPTDLEAVKPFIMAAYEGPLCQCD